MPKVSIITAAYNGEKYLAKTIDSVIGQTFLDWEYIIVDDGSFDGTKEIIEKYLRDRRIKYIHQENAGQAHARNTAYRICKGEYIAVLDMDDLWAPQKLEKQIKILDENPTVGLVYTNIQRIDKDGNIIDKPKIRDISNNPISYLIMHNEIAFSSVLIRKKNLGVFLHNENFKYTGDCYLYVQLAQKGILFYYVKEVLLSYRIHPKSISHGMEFIEARFQEQIKMMNELSKYYMDNNEKRALFSLGLSKIYLRYASGLIQFGQEEDQPLIKQSLIHALKLSKNFEIIYKVLKQFLKNFIYSHCLVIRIHRCCK